MFFFFFYNLYFAIKSVPKDVKEVNIAKMGRSHGSDECDNEE